jgi:xanthine dehydrogenase accessory factor
MLAPVALQIGFRVFVLDDRADYASAVRFPIPIETRVGDIAMTLRGWPIDARTYVVIVTRGHRHDEAALRAVVDSPARYVGMIGSKRKIEVTFDDLRRSGVSDERLGRVRAPIGMDIRAVTAEEIAVSIAAELISVRRTTRRRSGEGPVPFDGG